MSRYEVAEKANIPSIRGFSEDLLKEEVQYIIIANFNYVPVEPKGLIVDDEDMVFNKSGLSNEIFFEVMWDFAKRHGKEIIMFEEESIVMTGGQRILDCLNIECGDRFCYVLSDADEIGAFCAHERNLILANAWNGDQNVARNDVKGHSNCYLNS